MKCFDQIFSGMLNQIRNINRFCFDNGKVVIWKDAVNVTSHSGFIGSNVCIFSHYSHNLGISSGSLYYLSELSKLGFSTIFVSTSVLSVKDIDTLKRYASLVIQRDNVGYDFGSWATGLEYINVGKCKKILLVNDSVIGPLSNLSIFFEEANARGLDFWSITDTKEICYHLQSYFLCFESRAIKSGLLNFFKNVKCHKFKSTIIMRYEIGLSNLAHSLGLTMSGIVSVNDWRKTISRQIYGILGCSVEELNPTLRCALHLLNKFKLPFLKKELLFKNTYSVSLDPFIDCIDRNLFADSNDKNYIISLAREANIHL